MKRTLLAILSVALLAGCGLRSRPERIAKQHVANWDSMGMHLPKDQVPFFATNFPRVSGVLADAIHAHDPRVRQRAAYMVDELGPLALSMQTSLAARVESETNRLVRLYVYGALNSIGTAETSTVATLRSAYEALPKDESKESEEDIYTSLDERIYLASALYVLDTQPHRREVYLHEVTQWLMPPPDDLKGSELDRYWDHRWCAVNAVEEMRGAVESLPLLRAMLEEEERKPWVSTHVPRAIRAIETGK